MQARAKEHFNSLLQKDVAPHQISFTAAGAAGLIMFVNSMEGCDASYYLTLGMAAAAGGLGVYQYGVNNTIEAAKSGAMQAWQATTNLTSGVSAYASSFFKKPEEASTESAPVKEEESENKVRATRSRS